MINYAFNKPYKKIGKKSIYAQEHGLLHDFLASGNENIRFEYENTNKAVAAAQALKNYVKAARQPLEIKQRGVYVFAIYEEKTEVKENE